MVSRSALEMLLQGKEPADPQGKRTGAGERSQPTGWGLKKGSVMAQELQFPNGYTVLALQVEGQKSVIKGPQAWLGLLKAMETGDVQAVVTEWLERISQGMEKRHPEEVIHVPSPDPRQVSREGQPDRVAALEKKVDGLRDTMSQLIEKLSPKS